MSSRVRLLSAHLSPVRLVGTVASRKTLDKPADRLSATLAFDDPSAFRVKSWPELLRALGVFRFCSFPVLVNNSGKVRKECLFGSVCRAYWVVVAHFSSFKLACYCPLLVLRG